MICWLFYELWLSCLYALLALFHPVEVRKKRLRPLVFLYRNVLGGIHPNIDLQNAWNSIHLHVSRYKDSLDIVNQCPTFRMCYDDQFNRPFGETCRNSLGYIVSPRTSSVDDAQRCIAYFRKHPLITSKMFKLGAFPSNYSCIIAEFPHYGPISHAIALIKITLWQISMARVLQLPRTKVPGVMQILDVKERKITFVCPLEDRDDMLPY